MDEKNVYRLGYVLASLKDPGKIVYRSEDPILEPEKDYELYGEVPNVVFSCGAVIKGGKLFVYYGCADKVIGVATAEFSLFAIDGIL